MFYAAHSKALLTFFAGRTYDAQVALDLTAETFACAYERSRSFRGSTEGEARSWLYGIAHHLLSRFYRSGAVERRAVRRLGVQVPSVSEDDYAAIEAGAQLSEARGRVEDGLGRLSADQRRAVQLRVVEELPYDEVARRLSVSEPTARARVSRGLRALAVTVRPLVEEGSSHDAIRR